MIDLNERKFALEEIRMGILSSVEYRVKFFNETEEVAKGKVLEARRSLKNLLEIEKGVSQK